ncbi:MAG: glycerophosphodiester phosphodiesterase [Anaerolineae bacterium]|nr:glycerophosphodiester phosphodiesterase [Anaerolineae bacterium]MDW8100608.1 glycerophosphodiester phosphodiesterase [Anaerolineae bacterium]
MRNPHPERPLIFAHRGAKAVAPENTIPAFLKAIELGADGVELDVQFSADGALVVIHNVMLDETTNGHGRVTAHTLEELKALDAGSWFAPEFAGTRLCTLEEALDAIGHRLLVNIEMKSFSMGNDGMAEQVAEIIRRRNLYDQVIVSSFNPFTLRRLKKVDPRIETGLLYAPGLPIYLSRAWLRPWAKPDALHPEYVMVDEAYMRWARQRGYPVNVWTVNEPDEMRKMIALGVNAIITDYPDRLRELLES